MVIFWNLFFKTNIKKYKHVSQKLEPYIRYMCIYFPRKTVYLFIYLAPIKYALYNMNYSCLDTSDYTVVVRCIMFVSDHIFKSTIIDLTITQKIYSKYKPALVVFLCVWAITTETKQKNKAMMYLLSYFTSSSTKIKNKNKHRI